MTRRPAETLDVDPAFDALALGRLAWIGLGTAAVGWALIIGETSATAILFARAGRLPPSFHADVLEIAKCVLISGIGLAIIGALQTGFGTLNRFFGAVLLRSGRRDGGALPATPMTQPVEEPPRAGPPSVGRRPYRLFSDGSVEVDMILGTRLFRSMAEARDFI